MFNTIGGRVAVGLVAAALIVLFSNRRGLLSRSGTIAATGLAAITCAAGWSWAAILIAFFLSSSALSRAGESRKRALTDDVAAKGSNRDWKQVLANGGIFGAMAIGSIAHPGGMWELLAAGAIAASSADTWATEIGTVSSAHVRSITTFEEVPAGTSGGVTLVGLAAAVAGAAFIGLAARLLGWTPAVLWAAFAGGFAGSILDSVLGATIQARRWCEQCQRGTERAVHVCGMKTIEAGGVSWLDNDVVNALSSLGGALVAALWLI